ncbi:hypothetical protein [Mycolicibacterium sp. P9-64]|uniref:hypothetical protein n=1 Tax=Mycolicibacterium sp. P9-64 TaxID=2024612 RepID=UPI001F5B79AF|nr:hypothetical protein [Mycolicibacterium sp. P9-64]
MPTTTPGGAEVTVEPVEVEAVDVDVDGVDVDGVAVGADVGADVGSAGGVDVPEGSGELCACVPPAGSADDSDDDGDDGESPGVSAHATLGPVSRTAPTPSATARDPTRPTYAAALI